MIALFLTPLAASPVRADSWFKFGSSGKKPAPAAKDSGEKGNGEVVQAGFASVSDEDCDDDGEDGSGGSLSSRLQARRQARVQRRQMARDLAAVEPAPCYPQINSALYPCPRPDVPWEVGQTVITNQAFYPHEFLYCHRYKAIYPPFYYENKCGLTSIPFFPKPPIKGTVVKVKYKSTLPASFYPPFGSVKKCFSNTQWR